MLATCRHGDEERDFYPIFLGPNDLLGVRVAAAIAPAGGGVGAAAGAVLARKRLAAAGSALSGKRHAERTDHDRHRGHPRR